MLYSSGSRTYQLRKEVQQMSRISRALNVNASRVSAHPHTRTNWPTAIKPAFYAAFYAVDEATWGTIA